MQRENDSGVPTGEELDPMKEAALAGGHGGAGGMWHVAASSAARLDKNISPNPTKRPGPVRPPAARDTDDRQPIHEHVTPVDGKLESTSTCLYGLYSTGMASILRLFI